MEISHFLHNLKTIQLREKFLETVFVKHEMILAYMNEFQEDLSENKKMEIVSSIFSEVHKLKGAGGTYGFYEISRVYFNALIYIRPAQNEIRMLTKDEFDSATLIFNAFTKYYPVLKNAFFDLQNEVQHCGKSVLCVSKDRGDFFRYLEQFSLSNKLMLFSVMTVEDALFALDKISSGIVFIEVDNNNDDDILSLIKQMTYKEYLSEIIIITEKFDRIDNYLKQGATQVLSPKGIDLLELAGGLL